ncbi:MAG: AzlC family ABC transporter permease [Treponema sp.]|jgi:4-azaleucine resistance transporter AzlC|nr:AzlC family ABC transporter permease [Treponema sp.]
MREAQQTDRRAPFMPNKRAVFVRAVRYSIPVLLGYLAIGVAFGLLLVDAGYPWQLSLVMSVVMYAGAGQYSAVGLFSTGAGLMEAALVQFVVNARHMAYGLTMRKRFNMTGKLKYYLMFALTDETFALLSSLPAEPQDAQGGQDGQTETPEERAWFMFYVSLLDHGYWTVGSVIGAAAGSLIPFSMEGIGFALTALFIVLLIEQLYRIKKPLVFVVSAFIAVIATTVFPSKLSLLVGMAISLVVVQLVQNKKGVIYGKDSEFSG